MIKRITLIFVMLLFFGITHASAEIPKLINYQGRITDAQGAPLTGSYAVTFRVYDAASGGNMLWEEAHSGVVVNKGLFNVLLGSVANLNIPFDKPYFLEIKVGSEVMSPRQQIAASAYAMRAGKAEDADKFGSKSSSEYVLTSEITSAPTANKAVKLDGNAKLPVSALKVYNSGWFQVGMNGTWTKNHNLGTTKVIVQFFGAASIDGSGTSYLLQPWYDIRPSTDIGNMTVSISTTQLKVETLSPGITIKLNSGNEVYIRSLKVIMLALE